METIKQVGLKKLINSEEFSDPFLDVQNCLSSDLTAQEIEESLAVIKITLEQLTEFIEKYDELSKKLNSYEEKLTAKKADMESLKKQFKEREETIKKHKQAKENKKDYSLWNAILSCLGFGTSRDEQLSDELSETSDSISYREQYSSQENALLKEIGNIESNIAFLKQQKKNLFIADAFRNAPFEVNSANAFFISNHLKKLESILRKMHIIATDKDITASARLLAMENLLCLLNKQEIDKKSFNENQFANKRANDLNEKLLNETKRANELAEERIKTMQQMEHAVNLQTEFQIWSDLGSEAGKATVAHLLYKDNQNGK